MPRLLRISILVLSGQLLVACSAATNTSSDAGSTVADGGLDGGAPVTQTVGPAGGTVQVGGVTMTIPAGALAAETNIEVVPGVTPPAALPANLTAITPVVKFLPHGTQFASPVTIEIALLSGAQTDNPAASFLANEQDTTWEEFSAATIMDGKLRLQTTHLSYITGHRKPPQSCVVACNPACGTGETCVSGTCAPIVANRCGTAAGYQVNSPAPTRGGCESRNWRTSARGPATTPTVAWQFPSGNATDNLVMGPAIAADGSVYVTSEKGLIKLNPADGSTIWRVPASSAASATAMRGPPILLADGGIVACSTSGLSRFSPCNGAVEWTVPGACSSDYALDAIPVVGPNGNIYLPGMRIVSPAGTLVLDQENAIPCGANELSMDSAGNLYCDGLTSYTPAGVRRWGSNAGNMVFQHPVVVGTGSNERVGVYASRGSHYRITMFPLTGNPVLVDDYGDRFANQYLSDTTYGHYGVLSNGDFIFVNIGFDNLSGGVERYTFDPKAIAAGAQVPTPSPAWQSTTPQGTRVAYQGGSYPTIDADDNIYYGSFNGHAIALSPSGTVLWDVTLPLGADPAAWTVALGADRTAYVLAGRGFQTKVGLYALRAP